MPTRVGDLLGRAGGLLLAPITLSVSALRGARTFHPRGVTLRAEVRPRAHVAPWDAIGARLRGPALVRMSSAWWKRRELADVLGIAIRFTRSEAITAAAAPGDQDLLFATIRRPWTMPFAPISTRHHDFFANRYFAVAPFRVPGVGAVEWRLVPGGPIGGDGSREDKLARALEQDRARFVLEARPYRRVFDWFRRRHWHPVAEVVLREPVDVDQEALRFDPFRAGRGIQPAGFVQSLRRASYAASQRGRRLRRGARPRG